MIHLARNSSKIRTLGSILGSWLVFLGMTLLNATHADAVILKIKSIEEIADHIRPDTLVVLDLDNTVVEPHQTLGSDEWFGDSIQRNFDEGKPYKEALLHTLNQWSQVQLHAPMKPVEPGTLHLIRNLQRAGNPVLGLTARYQILAERTIEQLRALDLDFLATPIVRDNRDKELDFGLRYHKGIIFVGDQLTKGQAFEKFIDHHQLKPSHVVFVDDRVEHAESMEQTLISKNIDHTVFRYGFNDHKRKIYRREIADIQWHYFKNEKKLISDLEAIDRLR